MELNALVDEIVARVNAKITALDAVSAPAAPSAAAQGKPKLLVLTQQHDTDCHTFLENAHLGLYYHLDCALAMDYRCNVADYEAVLLFDLTVDAMGKLAGGVCDTPFTALAQRAILLGKKIFAPEQAIELLHFADTAAAAYYQMLLGKLELLKSSGVTVCPGAALVDTILSGGAEPAVSAAAPAAPAAADRRTRTVALAKKVITERDIAAVYERDLKAVQIGSRSIVTDLAREYAAARSVSIVRD